MFYLVLFFGGFPFPTLLIKLTLLSLVLLLSPLTVFTLLTLPILYCTLEKKGYFAYTMYSIHII